MKELATLIICSVFTFSGFIVTLIVGLIRKNKRLKIISLFLFVTFFCLASWTVFKFITKSVHAVSEMMEPRTGDEIYDALFDTRQTECVKILNYQDQIIPKVDYAIWLELETCPEELQRILSRHPFKLEKLPANNAEIPLAETIKWFNPTTMGDTILVFEYATEDGRNIQTIWSNSDSTKIFVRDILD